MFPASANFNSSVPDSAWILVRTGGDPQLCQFTGAVFLVSVNSKLRFYLQESGARELPTFDGTRVFDTEWTDYDPAGTVTGPGWSRGVLAALYAVARRFDAPRDALNAIESDARRGAGPMSLRTLQVAAWIEGAIAESDGRAVRGRFDLDAITIRQDTMTPLLGLAPPMPADRYVGSGLACRARPDLRSLAPPIVVGTMGVMAPILVISLLLGAGVTAAYLMRKVPRYAEIRGRRRRNPYSLHSDRYQVHTPYGMLSQHTRDDAAYRAMIAAAKKNSRAWIVRYDPEQNASRKIATAHAMSDGTIEHRRHS